MATTKETNMRSKERVIADALKRELGCAEDDLYRARTAARRADPAKEWGDSGQSLATIIAEYETRVAELRAAMGGK